jgi:hypothetical protein
VALPKNRNEFKALCLRNCGFPVVEVEIDDQQVEDIIDLCLEYYYDYHFAGSEKIFISHKVTEEDYNNRYIPISNKILSILRVFDISANNTMSNPMWGIRYQLALNEMFHMSLAPMTPFQNVMRHVSLLTEMFAGQPGIRYNRHRDKLFIETNWKTDVIKDKYIVIEAYQKVTPEENPDIWSDRWLIKYVSEYIKFRAADNLRKMNITLIGNVSYNGDLMYSTAQDNIRQMEQEMIDSYSIPAMFTVG